MNRRKRVDSRKYNSRVIFTYSIKHLTVKDKVRFYYALKGRDSKSGIIKKYKIEQVGRTVLLVNSKYENQVQEFFLLWKCKFKKKLVLVKRTETQGVSGAQKSKAFLAKTKKSKIIFTYSLKHLLQKDKVRFYYALKGRDGKSGIIKKYKIEQLARTVLLVNSKSSKQIEEFLTFWKCKFKKKEVLIQR